MCRCRSALAVLTLVLMSLLVAGPASAGGPTSVLLVVPGSGQTASLYASDPDYEALAGLVGAFGAGGGAGTVDKSGASHEVGTGVTLTWLIHDVSVWRVDRIYLGADGGPWIATQTTDGVASIWDSPVVWHTSAGGKELSLLLDRLGVRPGSGSVGDAATASASAGGGSGVAAGVVPPVPEAEQSNQAAQRPTGTGTPSEVGLMWGLAGLALGVALAMAGLRLVPRPRPAPVEAATGEPADDVRAGSRVGRPEPDSTSDWSLTDELSWPAPRG